MTVTTQSSSQITNTDAVPRVLNASYDAGGRVRCTAFNFTQSGAGDATSTATLCDLPAGKIRILEIVSKTSAFGASRVCDIGHTGWTKQDGTAQAAVANAYADDIDVSSAATTRTHVNTVIDGKTGTRLIAAVAGGTIPDGATINGYVLWVKD